MSQIAPVQPGNLIEPGPRLKRWTRDEYYRMARSGVFEGQRVELIDGEIIEMSPHGFDHAAMVNVAQDVLMEAFGEGYCIRVQLPLSISLRSEPEPDIAVVPGKPRDYLTQHPSTAVLVLEVSDSSLDYDIERKAGLYASAGIPDYWIVNLPQRRLDVLREPVADSGAEFGHRYASVRHLEAADRIAPLARPEAMISVADLLP